MPDNLSVDHPLGPTRQAEDTHPLIADHSTQTSSPASQVTDKASGSELWTRAVQNVVKGLPKDDGTRVFEVQTIEDLMDGLHSLHNKYDDRYLSRILTRLGPYIETMKLFSNVISVFVSSNPAVSALIWGSLKLIIELTIRSAEAVEKITDVLNDIAVQLPHLDLYRRLFPGEEELERALVEVYSDIIRFCINAIKFFRRHPALNIIRSIWTSFEADFQPHLRRLTLHKEWVEMEVFAINLVNGERRHEELMKLLMETAGTIKSPMPKMPCHVIPFSEPQGFFGRSTILEHMAGFFEKSASTGRQTAYALLGLGGVGKTQIALRHTYNFLSSYQAVFWVSADTEEKLLQDFQNIAISLELSKSPNTMVPSRARDIVLQWLQGYSVPWLLIFDNVDDIALLEKFWPKNSRGGSIIITARNPDLGRTMSIDYNVIQPFDPEEGAGFVQSLTGSTADELEEARAIAEKLGGLPLGISHIAGFIRETSCSLSEFNELYNDRESQMEVHGLGSTSTNFQYGRPLSAAWEMSLSKLPRDSRIILCLMFFYDPDGVPESLFLTGIKRVDPPVTSLAFLTTKAKYMIATSALYRQALIQRNRINQTISIHRLVQLETSRAWNDEDFDHNFHLAAKLLNGIYPSHENGLGMTKFWTECSLYVPHVFSLVHRYESMKLSHPPTEFIDLLNRCGWYLYERGLFTGATSILKLADRICDEELPSTLLQAETYTGLACLYKAINQKAVASVFAEKAVSIREQLLDSSNILVANAYNNYGIILNDLDKIDEACTIHLRAVELKESMSNCPPALLAQSYSNAGRTMTRIGRLNEASLLIEKAITLRSSAFGLTNRYTSVSIYALGNVRIAQGNIEDAIRLHMQCLVIRREILGPDAFYTGLSCHKVGVLRREQGSLDEAADLLRLAMGIFEKIPEVAADVARTGFMLAQVLAESGVVEEARELRDKVSTIKKRITHVEASETESWDDYDVLTAYDNR